MSGAYFNAVLAGAVKATLSMTGGRKSPRILCITDNDGGVALQAVAVAIPCASSYKPVTCNHEFCF